MAQFESCASVRAVSLQRGMLQLPGFLHAVPGRGCVWLLVTQGQACMWPRLLCLQRALRCAVQQLLLHAAAGSSCVPAVS